MGQKYSACIYDIEDGFENTGIFIAFTLNVCYTGCGCIFRVTSNNEMRNIF